ncbi:MAG: Exocyst complex component 5 [Icmadophila ericetorum]|nr:Exocyst complex component 5 [Icmadophila ericetorum]
MPGTIDTPVSPSILTPSYGARSLFPQAPSFTLETFSSRDFSVKDCIELLTESAVPSNRRSLPSNQAQAFDPKPMIRSFEHTLNLLAELSRDQESLDNELSTKVRRAEAEHERNGLALGGKLTNAIESFNNLDISLNGNNARFGPDTTIKVGERIEELDRQRVRAQDAKFLIQCWLEVSERGEFYLLEDMRRQGSGEKKIRCAQIARQLLKLSQRLDPESWKQVNGRAHPTNGVNGDGKHSRPRYNTREIIEKFSETLETDLLTQFDEFYRRANFDGMKDCATVLHDFNDGASAIGLFVNQHQFFIDRSQLVNEEVGGDAEAWNRLADPDADSPGIEPSLQSLIDEVKVVVLEESGIIKKAFPYYEQVLGQFLQRVFQQSIQQRLELVLEKANTISTLAFLRSLQSSRSYINSLVDDLKSHGLTEHPEPLSAQTALVLDQQFDDLFVPYFVGSSYLEREKKNLEELYSSLLFKFTIFHSRRRKIPTTFMASLAKSGSEMLASAREAYIERLDSSDLAGAQKAMLLRLAGLKDIDSAKKQNEIEFTEQDGMLSTSNAKRMLKWLAEAVGRGLELSGGNETPKDVSALLDLLLTHMGELYIETALDAALDAATAQESSKSEPDLTYLSNLHSAITIMHLMATCINTVLIPLAASHITVRREMEKITAAAMHKLEDKVNMILQRTIDVAISWVSKLLSQQKKNDFRPKDDGISGQGTGGTTAGGTGPGSTGAPSWLESLQTPTCLATTTFLTKLHTHALCALTPQSQNLTTFLTEIALGIRTLLLEHFKKFPVNAAGGIVVTKDLAKYIELFRGWGLEEGFEGSLEVLTEIGNLFVVGSEALRERVRGGGKVGVGGVGLWDKSDMRAYILRREDVGSVGVQSVLSAL